LPKLPKTGKAFVQGYCFISEIFTRWSNKTGRISFIVL
jgi:hypothetical protein